MVLIQKARNCNGFVEPYVSFGKLSGIALVYNELSVQTYGI